MKGKKKKKRKAPAEGPPFPTSVVLIVAVQYEWTSMLKTSGVHEMRCDEMR